MTHNCQISVTLSDHRSNAIAAQHAQITVQYGGPWPSLNFVETQQLNCTLPDIAEFWSIYVTIGPRNLLDQINWSNKITNARVYYAYTGTTERITTTGRPQPDCNVGEPSTRVNCGFAGMRPRQCTMRGCCWDSSVLGVPWCFYGKDKHSSISTIYVNSILQLVGTRGTKKSCIDWCPSRENSSPVWRFDRQGLNPIAPAYDPTCRTDVG